MKTSSPESIKADNSVLPSMPVKNFQYPALRVATISGFAGLRSGSPVVWRIQQVLVFYFTVFPPLTHFDCDPAVWRHWYTLKS